MLAILRPLQQMSQEIEDAVSKMNIDGYETVSTPGKRERYVSHPSMNDEKMFRISKRIVLSTTPEIVEFHCFAPNVAAHCHAGQFVIVRANDQGERIPLTIADFDRKELTITLVCQSIGRSSKLINSLQEGEHFYDIAGPLGHPSDVRSNMGNIVLVAGGVGTAPVYPIAKAFHELPGNHVITIFGARMKDLIFWEDKMRSVSDEVYVTTDDGSYGIHGFGTTALQQVIDEAGYKKDDENAEKKRTIDLCYAIGPLPMMRAVCELTRPYKIPTIVSLNTIMVDGTGMCGACRVHVGDKTKFACVDGPEFDGHLVDWQSLRTRMGAYCEVEKKEKEAPIHKPEYHLLAKDAPKT